MSSTTIMQKETKLSVAELKKQEQFNANNLLQEIRKVVPEIMGDKEQVLSWMARQDESHIAHLLDPLRKYFKNGSILLWYRCPEYPDGIDDKRFKEEFKKLDLIDRKLYESCMLLSLYCQLPYDSISGYVDKLDEQIEQFEERMQEFNNEFGQK